MKYKRALRICGAILFISMGLIIAGCSQFVELVETAAERIEELLNSASELASFDLELPESAAIDQLGRLYMITNGQLEVYARDGSSTPQFEVSSVANAVDVALDADGYVYLLHESEESGQVAVFEPFGETAGVLPAQLTNISLPDGSDTPIGISVDSSDGQLYVLEQNDATIPVADEVQTRVQVFRSRNVDPARSFTHERTIGAHEVTRAVDFAVSDGDLYIVDQAQDAVRVYDTDRLPVSSDRVDSVATIGSAQGLTHPTAIAVDDAGSIYVADMARIQMFNGRLEYERTLELAGEDEAFSGRMSGLAIDPQRHLLVADKEAGKARFVRVEETAVCGTADQLRGDEENRIICFEEEVSGDDRVRTVYHPKDNESTSGRVMRLERLDTNGRKQEVTHYSYDGEELERRINRRVDDGGNEVDLWVETDGVRRYRYPEPTGRYRDCALPNLPCISHAVVELSTSTTRLMHGVEMTIYNINRDVVDLSVRVMGLDVGWLSTDIASEAIAANGSTIVTVTASATELEVGRYAGFIVITIGDNSHEVPVTLIHR